MLTYSKKDIVLSSVRILVHGNSTFHLEITCCERDSGDYNAVKLSCSGSI